LLTLTRAKLSSLWVTDVTDVTLRKSLIETLATQGTVSHAAQAAGVSRNTVYRWRDEDREFASLWNEAHETAVDTVESVLYQKALSGDTICMIFYLKAHRPMYRDKLNIDVNQLQSEIEERMAELGITPDSLARAIPALTD
jgi:transposase-like protein